MRFVKKLLLSVGLGIILTFALWTQTDSVYADSNDFFILDKADGGQEAVEILINKGGGVWDEYDKQAHENPELVWQENLANQIQTWIMTWDSLIFFLIDALQFLSQLGLLIGVLMIIFVGYQYASYSITWVEPKQSYIGDAITGILVISFSYAILQIITEAFL